MCVGVYEFTVAQLRQLHTHTYTYYIFPLYTCKSAECRQLQLVVVDIQDNFACSDQTYYKISPEGGKYVMNRISIYSMNCS